MVKRKIGGGILMFKRFKFQIAYIQSYGIELWGIKGLIKLISIFPNMKSILELVYEKKNQLILNYLEKEYDDIFTEFFEVNETTEKRKNINENAPIWICWWQGFDNAPDIVKSCIESTRRNAPMNKVHLITKYNFLDYVAMDEIILNRLRDNKISLAQFSDILRLNLLSKYGGLWLDATIYTFREINPNVFQYPFFTLKSEINSPAGKYVSDNAWTGFCLGASKGHPVMSCLSKVIIQYNKVERPIIDYFLLDYLLKICEERYPKFKNQLDFLPSEKQSIYSLQDKLNCKYNSNFFDLYSENSYFLKLNYKQNYKQYDENFFITFYGELIRE